MKDKEAVSLKDIVSKARSAAGYVADLPGHYIGRQGAAAARDAGAAAKIQMSELGQHATDTLKRQAVNNITSVVKQVAPGMAAGAVTGGLAGATHDDPRLGAGRGMIAGALGGIGGRALGPGISRSALGGATLGGAAGGLFGKSEPVKKMKKTAARIQGTQALPGVKQMVRAQHRQGVLGARGRQEELMAGVQPTTTPKPPAGGFGSTSLPTPEAPGAPSVSPATPAAPTGTVPTPTAPSVSAKTASAKMIRSQEKPMKNKYAGVTLDWYDDKGATLKTKFPTVDQLPDIIKEANVRPSERLNNEDFALVAIDEGNVLRKFACHDPGTTAMSVIYFMEHGDKLPDGAQKMAAANLVGACERFGLRPPSALEKIAGATEALMRIPQQASSGSSRLKDLASKILSNRVAQNALVGAGGGAATGGVIGGTQAEKGQGLHDTLKGMGVGALAGGGLGALYGGSSRFGWNLGSGGLSGEPRVAKGLRLGSAGLGGLMGGTVGGILAPKDKEAAVIDITGQRPSPKMKVASSDNPDDYAVVMPDGRRFYPIHTWDLVKKAEDYFHDKKNRMQPEIRRQYAVKLAAKAEAMGYPIDPEILDAGATEWAPKGHLKAAVEMRKIACQPGPDRQFLDELFEKRAELDPGTYAEVLRRFDVKRGLDHGWDHVILDPWASTYGMNKQADVVWEDGNDRVTNDQLVSLAQNHLPKLRQILTEGMCKEFLKDPVGIFESMPLPQKKIISRLASDHPEYSEITQAVV